MGVQLKEASVVSTLMKEHLAFINLININKLHKKDRNPQSAAMGVQLKETLVLVKCNLFTVTSFLLVPFIPKTHYLNFQIIHYSK